MTSFSTNTEAPPDWRDYVGWLLVGFALGGFFDGIVLHQILQWHHLLSGLDDPLRSDLHFQIMMDGLFHLFMYLVAVVAIVLLAARRSAARSARAAGILRPVLIGFAIWHIADAILSHWLIGLHRIRMDSENPLIWDVAWLVLFGIVPLVIAFFLPTEGNGSRPAAASVLTVMVAAGLAAGAAPSFSSQPSQTIVIFRKHLEPAQMMHAVLQADASIRWTDASGTIWSVEDLSWRGMATLYANGALMVGSTPAVAGCLAWTRPA